MAGITKEVLKPVTIKIRKELYALFKKIFIALIAIVAIGKIATSKVKIDKCRCL